MRVADIVTASILILLGGLVLADALRLGAGWGSDGPNSGFFPFWLALIMVLSCAVIIVQAARKPTDRSFVTREKVGPVFKVLWPATASVMLIHWVGLYVSSALYIGFYMRWVGRHTWSAVVLLAFGIPVTIFFVFEKWFYVPMPKGPLEAWLGY
jgi:hypothetical protein